MPFLKNVQNLQGFLPCVQSPPMEIPIRQKTIYTAITLFIYLICCQIPLYGVQRAQTSDPFQWMRVILASHRGSLMQLGLTPVITSGWILQLMVGAKMIDVDLNDPKDRKLYAGASKILALLLTFGQAFAYIYSGNYGRIEDIGHFKALLILIQLSVAGVIVIILDQMLEKGYGLGSGVSLFIAANMCQFMFWRTLSPITTKTQAGTQFEGCFIALFHFLITKPSTLSAIYMAFFRSSLPNLSSVMATILVFFLVIYLQGFKVNLRLANQKFKGYQIDYPIKLFYTSNISVILMSALISNLATISQMLYTRFKGNVLIRLFGQWQNIQGRWVPVGGFSYYITSPQSFNDILYHPIRSAVSTIFVMAVCAFFSRYWIEITKQSPKDVAQRLRDQGYMIAGSRQHSLSKTLNKYIPTAAICGGMVIGLVSILSDLLGAIGSGTGILITVTIIYGYFEKIAHDKKDSEIAF